MMVYLIECVRDYDIVYKIGYSKHPKKRINELKTGNDGNLKIIHSFTGCYDRKVEKVIQNFFSHKKINREWFKLDIEDVQNFNSLCQKVENNLSFLDKNVDIILIQ